MQTSGVKLSESSQSENIVKTMSSDQVEKVVKASVLVIALIYSVGLIETNMYLMRFGISDFSSLKPRYILTGAWVLWILALVAGPAYFVTIQFRERRYVVGCLLLLGYYTMSLLLWVATAVVWRLPNRFELLGFLGILALCSFIPITIAQLGLKRHTAQLTIVIFISLLMFLHVIAVNIYAIVPDAWGGGKPMLATLTFNRDGADVWRKADLEIDPKTDASGFIRIVYQDDRNIYVEAQSDHLIIINRSLIDLIRPEQDYLEFY